MSPLASFPSLRFLETFFALNLDVSIQIQLFRVWTGRFGVEKTDGEFGLEGH